MSLQILQEAFKKMQIAGESTGSPQYGHSLAQLARFRFRVAKLFLFCLIWDHKSSKDFRRLSKKFKELGSSQEVLNIDIP
jgi:hypothetical protein